MVTQAVPRGQLHSWANPPFQAIASNIDTENDSDSVVIIENNSDGVVIIKNDNDIQLLDGPTVSDIVELGSAPRSGDTKRRVKYLKRYTLVMPPPQSGLEHAQRARDVLDYFTCAPRLADPAKQQLALFQWVSQDMRQDPKWAAEEECMVCFTAPSPEILLSCGCCNRLFYLSCVRDWHEKEDPACQNLVQCPTCKQGTKPVHLAWVAPSPEKIEARKITKAKKKHAKVKETRGKDPMKARKKARTIGGGTLTVAATPAAGPSTQAAGAATAAEQYIAPGLFMQGGVLFYR
ncbi:hypothetical protein B0H19DRAFT_1245804 [Mycena capillaripes]|nr:hypothetical protein B0H19DRAFT_1245804 [Mycena capillaripes]